MADSYNFALFVFKKTYTTFVVKVLKIMWKIDKIPLISNKGVHCTVIKCQGNIFNRRGLKYSNKLTFKVTDKGTVTFEENLMYTVYV